MAPLGCSGLTTLCPSCSIRMKSTTDAKSMDSRGIEPRITPFLRGHYITNPQVRVDVGRRAETAQVGMDWESGPISLGAPDKSFEASAATNSIMEGWSLGLEVGDTGDFQV